MTSNIQLRETLKEMGFSERLIEGALSLLKDNATLETVLDAVDTGKAEAEAKRLEENLELAKETPDEKKPLSEEAKELKKKEMEDKIKKRREEIAKADAEADRQREIQRRKDGQDMGKVKEEIESLQQKRHIENLKKEKNEAKAARDLILKQIEMDKADRRARMEGAEIYSQSGTSCNSQAKTPQLTSQPSKNGKTKLAIRLFDGSQIVEEFEDREPLAAVRAYIVSKQNIIENITFSMPPLKAFNEQDMQMSLFGLGLSPNARLTLVRRP